MLLFHCLGLFLLFFIYNFSSFVDTKGDEFGKVCLIDNECVEDS